MARMLPRSRSHRADRTLISLCLGLGLLAACARAPEPGGRTPEALLLAVANAVESRDGDRFRTCLRGGEASENVFMTLFDLACEARALSDDLKSTYGDGSLSHSAGTVSTDRLLPQFTPDQVRTTTVHVHDESPGTADARTDLWDSSLILTRNEDGRWFIDTDATLRADQSGEIERLGEIHQRALAGYLQAVKATREQVGQPGMSREQVLLDMAGRIQPISVRHLGELMRYQKALKARPPDPDHSVDE